MRIEEIFRIKLDEKVLDQLDLFLIDRFTGLTQERAKAQAPEDKEVYEKLESLVMEVSEDKEKGADFLAKLVDSESEAQEDFYLLGVRDGIKFLKTVCMI